LRVRFLFTNTSVRRRRDNAGLRTSSLVRRSRPISLVPPRHGVAFSLKAKRSSGRAHTGRNPGGSSAPFVILHIALTCFHQSISYLLRIDLTACIVEIVPRTSVILVHALNIPYYVFFHTVGIYCIVLAINPPCRYQSTVQQCLIRVVSCAPCVSVNQPIRASCSYFPPQTRRPYPTPVS